MTPNNINEGSLSQLWKISFPLMLSFFSMVTMTFVDRLFLANYSTNALSAATSAGMFYWAGNLMIATLCSMAQVLVAQYNGAKKYQKLGEPVWQMIWLAIFSSPVFFLLATLGSNFFYQSGFFNVSEVLYYKWNNFFCPVFSLLAAISAFFIGQGKTQIIKWAAILGNVINIVLDPIFIFGVDRWIPSMGIKGAAIATGLGVITQTLVLGSCYFRRNNQKVFGTHHWKFNLSVFWNCLKVGIPPATFIIFELIGWALFYKIMEKTSPKHILVMSVTQSIVIFLNFFGLALEKGAATIAGNLIGAKAFNELRRVFTSGLILCLIFATILSIAFIGFPRHLINWFFHNSAALDGDFAFSQELIMSTKSSIKFSLAILVIYLTFENIRHLLVGMLTSSGDKVFLMVTGSCSIWLFMLAPTYFFMLKPQTDIATAFYICVFYSFATSLVLYLRILKNKWCGKTSNLCQSELKNRLPG